jgi:hypothetical protein
MTSTEPVHPLAAAAQRALDKAASLGGADLARWDSTGKRWIVASASTPGREYYVSRVHADVRAEAAAAKTPGPKSPFGWLFTLTCSCQSYHDGREHKACWHKGAVRLWWSAHAALDGDQIARRNLVRARFERAAAERDAAERQEETDGGGPFQHSPPRDRQDGADAHTINRRVPPMDRGKWPDTPDDERAYGPVYYDVSDDGTVYHVDPDAPDNSLDAPAGRFYDGEQGDVERDVRRAQHDADFQRLRDELPW